MFQGVNKLTAGNNQALRISHIRYYVSKWLAFASHGGEILIFSTADYLLKSKCWTRPSASPLILWSFYSKSIHTNELLNEHHYFNAMTIAHIKLETLASDKNPELFDPSSWLASPRYLAIKCRSDINSVDPTVRCSSLYYYNYYITIR